MSKKRIWLYCTKEQLWTKNINPLGILKLNIYLFLRGKVVIAFSQGANMAQRGESLGKFSISDLFIIQLKEK